MDYTAEMLAQLKAGKTPEELAKELTIAIKKATDENERLKAEEAKRKETEDAKLRKLGHIDNLLDAVVNLLMDYGVREDIVKAVAALSAEDILCELDATIIACLDEKTKRDPVREFLKSL